MGELFMQTIAIYKNPEKDGADAAEQALVASLSESCRVLTCDEHTLKEMADEADLAVVLGGDGTMLIASKYFAQKGVPMLGVNLGRVGYMTGLEPDDVAQIAPKLLSGDYKTENRMMLKIRAARDGKTIYEGHALNDGVISTVSRMIHLSAQIDKKLVYRFAGNGIIVATPTGSTAYSLSAGGPVAAPDMEVMIATPICPHNMYTRPVLASPDSCVRICIDRAGDGDSELIVDGQPVCSLSALDEVTFEKSDTQAKLIYFKQTGFYEVLYNKLSGRE